MTPETPDPPPVSPDPWKDVERIYPYSDSPRPDGPACYFADTVDAARAADALRHQQEIADLSAQVEDAELRYRVTYTSLCDQAAQAVALRAALSTAEDTPRMAERTDRQPDQSWLARIRAGLEAHDRGDLNPNADMFAWESVAYLLPFAALLRERDAQIASLTAQVEQQKRAFEDECGRHEQTLIGKRGFADLVAQLGAERDAAQQEAQTLREALEQQQRWATSLAEYLDYNHGNHESDAAWGEFMEQAHEKPPVHGCECARCKAALSSSPRPQATETKPGIFVAHESTSVFARPQEPQPAEPKSSETRKPVVNLMEALKKSLDSLNANRTSQEPGGHQP